jgi:hypothetical protein
MSRDTHLPRNHVVAFDGVVHTIPDSTCLSQQTKWTICIGFSVDLTLTKRVAGVQKLSEGDS